MIKHFLETETQEAVKRVYPDCEVFDFEVESSDHCDYATNVAMTLAGQVKQSPLVIARVLKEALEKKETFSEFVESVEIAGPGFLNIMLRTPSLVEGVRVVGQGLDNGLHLLPGTKANIEFISANPTGKLHIGHGRGAFYGDALAKIYNFAGGFITREYYINNSRESKQIRELGKTALGKGEQYKTPALEKNIGQKDFSGMTEEEAGAFLAQMIQKENRAFIEADLGVYFDEWYSEEKDLRVSGKVSEMKEYLLKKDLTYEKEGALWLKTSEYGDDEDRVIVRSDGKASYFLSDIAYHADKFSRELDIVFNIWGADHGGHIKRMQAVKKMLDWQGGFHIFVVQLVSLKGEGGIREKMSKRAGNVILIEDLVGEFDIDVVRWFFLEKSLSTQMNFDLELARENSEKNPVRYVQYAHARMCSLLEKSHQISEGSTHPKVEPSEMEEVLKNQKARKLALQIVRFPEVIEEITKDYAVHKLTTYTYELSQVFSQMYHEVRVIEEGGGINTQALALVQSTQKTLAKCLEFLGISAPEKM